MKSIFNFLFGKNPDIFTPEGKVRHKLPKDRWEAWKNRYSASSNYNWKNHTGMKAGGQIKGQ